MQLPKYRGLDPSIPAVELSLRPVEVDVQVSVVEQKEPGAAPPIPIDGDGPDAPKMDENELRALRSER